MEHWLIPMEKEERMLVYRGVDLFRDAEACIQRAKDSFGSKVGMVTTAHKNDVEIVLDRFFGHHIFDNITTQQDVEKQKPAPEPYRLGCEKLDLAPENVVVFEDSTNGVLAAVRAQIGKIIWIQREDFTAKELPPEIEQAQNIMLVQSLAEIDFKKLGNSI